MKKLLLSLVFIIGYCGVASAQTITCVGTLATVSACLAPGQWGEVTGMTNFTNVLGSGVTIMNELPRPTFYGGSGDNDTLLGFMDKAQWNQQTHELYIYGGAHTVTCPCERFFIKFNADTNTWSTLPMPPDATGLDWGGPGTGYPVQGKQTGGQHYYDYNSLDRSNQVFYIHESSNANPGEFRGMPFNIKTQTWGATLPHEFVQNAFTSDTLESYEFFPDLKVLVHTNGGAITTGGINYGVASQYDPAMNVWTWFNGSTFATPPGFGQQGYKLPMGINYSISRYDNQHHVLYFGGGAPQGGTTTATNQLYQYQVYNGPNGLPTVCNPTPAEGLAWITGCTTALTTVGAPAVIDSRNGLQEIDPVTGDLLIWQSNATPSNYPASNVQTLYKYHNGATAWTSADVTSNTNTVIVNPPYLTSDPTTNAPTFAEVTASVPDDGSYQGVILLLKHVSTTEGHLYVYKNAQKPSLASKCALSGVLDCRQFDSSSNIDSKGNALRYNWNAANSYLNNDPLLCVTFVGPTCTVNITNYPISGFRNTGEGNIEAFNMFATPTPSVNSIGSIDTTTKFEGGGALKIPMSQYSIEETSVFEDNLDGVLGHPNVAICSDITHCPQGNTIWAQAMVRIASPLINDYVFQCAMQIDGTCYNDSSITDHGIATTVVDCPRCNSAGYLTSFCSGVGIPGDCPSSYSGKRLFIYNGDHGSNCIPGIYTITAINNYNQVALDRTPSAPGTKCTTGTFLLEEATNFGGTQGWKLLLLVSNALATDTNCECIGEVMNRGNQTYPAAPQIYDSKGTNAPGVQLNYRHVANTWAEITEEVIVGSFNPVEGLTDAEVKWWLDGNLVYDWTGAKLDLSGGSSGYGLGQIQLETYTTKRDAFYAGSDPAGAPTWYDNVITSTQPIPFNRDAGGGVVTCSSPSKVVFVAQPGDAVVGSSLGTVVAQIEDSSGVLCTTATNSVTLGPHSGTTWATLHSNSSLTKSASGGVVSWNDLSVTPTAGMGSIDAASSGLTTGVSNSITISNVVSCTPAKVVITSQPIDAQLGASIGTITAQIQDSSNVFCSTATNSVTLSKHVGATWGTLTSASSLTKSAIAGTVSWSDLSVITTTGSGAIDIASSGLTGATTNSINITVVVPGGGGNLRRRRP